MSKDSQTQYAPKAVLLVGDNIPAITAAYREERESCSPTEAFLAAADAVFDPDDLQLVSSFIDGECDFISGEGAGAKFLADMAIFFEDVMVKEDEADEWLQELEVETQRRSRMNIVDMTEAWALDARYAQLCIDAFQHGDEDRGTELLGGVGSVIAGKAFSALTRTGRKVKIEQAQYVVKTIQRKNSRNDVIATWCDLLSQYLQEAHDAVR